MLSQACVFSTFRGGGGVLHLAHGVDGVPPLPPSAQQWGGVGGGVVTPSSQQWGTPSLLMGLGTSILPDEGHQDWTGWHTPPPPPRHPSGDRAAERTLATQRAVSLLRSRRRTFLFSILRSLLRQQSSRVESCATDNYKLKRCLVFTVLPL